MSKAETQAKDEGGRMKDEGAFHPSSFILHPSSFPPAPCPLRCLVITLSDRAAAGEYADRSGPRIEELLKAFFDTGRWQLEVHRHVLPDEPDSLRQLVLAGVESGADVIFTTGGTGISPRDITPETIAPLCEKEIPGIMEHIRAKFGADNPRARLSRAIAGVARKTQIYTLPGSVRAVEEYLGEILVTLEHVFGLLQDRDEH
jgi:molybdopterin adenylyltransferase